ncbi:ImmA/IrrE family metallo-endopeptidase [Nakamurella lactea]|uniref:ImmA/IrrE family metallo-endopeptidase n=1 Tax=Nakamurella lactea TaxID=459515 RepID=UPI0003FA0A26|nr:ImmA/IrrE family metallo-endopeptidase [Nakamurella lactea]
MPSADEFDPWLWAEARGIAVLFADLPPERFGEWHPDRRTIYLSTGLSQVQEWSTLTHECGHVALGHVGSKDQQEVDANRWAAERLIDPVMHDAATTLWGNDLCRIADELGVMMWVVNSWRCLLRDRVGAES